MRAVGALHRGRADGLHKLLAVMRELVDRVHVIVDHPDVLLGIVRIDGDEVRALENLVPLRPGFDDLALAIDDRQAMLPLRVHADGSFPESRTVVRILSRAAGAGKRGDRGVAPGQSADGELQARTEIGKQFRFGTLDVGKLAAEEQVNAIGILRVDSLARAPGPLLVAGKRVDILRPILVLLRNRRRRPVRRFVPVWRQNQRPVRTCLAPRSLGYQKEIRSHSHTQQPLESIMPCASNSSSTIGNSRSHSPGQPEFIRASVPGSTAIPLRGANSCDVEQIRGECHFRQSSRV